MKQSLCLAVLLVISGALRGQTVQTYQTDSLVRKLSENLSDTNRIWVLNNLGRNMVNTDSAIMYAQQALTLSRRIRFAPGEAEAFNNMGLWFNQKGNHLRSLENYLRAIKIGDSLNLPQSLKRSYNSISSVYIYRKDYATSIQYGYKARALGEKLNDRDIVTFSASWLSRAFLATNKLDSALKYAQISYESAQLLNKPFPLYMAATSLGLVHEKLNHPSIAIEYLRLALNNAIKDKRYFRIAEAHQKLAEAFRVTNQRDSCLVHAHASFDLSERENLAATALNSSLVLSKLYDGVNDKESLRYHKTAMSAMDSLFSQEQNNQIEALNMNEKLRQMDVEEKRLLAETDRRNNLQYAGITLVIAIFGIIFLVLGRSRKVKPSLIKFLGAFAMLMMFEFVNLLLAPGISRVTNNTPMFMLMVMIAVAAALIPVHQYVEKRVVRKVVEGNKLSAEQELTATQNQ